MFSDCVADTCEDCDQGSSCEDSLFTFKRDFGRIIEHFVKQTIHVTEDDLLELMGFPENWKKISAYTV